MKVLMLNGSPHAQGNTYIALHEMEKILQRKALKLRYCTLEIRTYAVVLRVVTVLQLESVYLMTWLMKLPASLKNVMGL